MPPGSCGVRLPTYSQLLLDLIRSVFRTVMRYAAKNMTVVLAVTTPLNYMLYMATIFKSDMSFFQDQRQFLVNTIGMKQLEVRALENQSADAGTLPFVACGSCS